MNKDRIKQISKRIDKNIKPSKLDPDDLADEKKLVKHKHTITEKNLIIGFVFVVMGLL